VSGAMVSATEGEKDRGTVSEHVVNGDANYLDDFVTVLGSTPTKPAALAADLADPTAGPALLDFLSGNAPGITAVNRVDRLKAWEDLFDFPNLRTNTGALDAVTKHRAGEVVPLPSTYLDASYISNHLAKFDNGGSYLVPTEVLDQFGRNLIGRLDGQFIAPAGEIDDLLAAANGNISVIEDALGIPSGAWQGKQLSRIDISSTSSHNRRLPSGNEAGANENWIPGGVTSGGKSEAVVDQIPIGSYTETVIN